MEWNFHNTGVRKSKTSQGFQMAILFLAVFSVSYFFVIVLGYFEFKWQQFGFMEKLITGGCLILACITGYIVVTVFKLQSATAIRCVAWPAGIIGAGLGVYAVYWGIEPALTEADRINLETLWFVALSLPYMMGAINAELAVIWSGYLISEKTSQYLSSYATKRHFSFAKPVQSADDFTVNDILNSEPTRERYESFSPTLYLDSVPDGEHFVSITFSPKSLHKFFTLKFTNKTFFVAILPLSRRQAEEIMEKCGPFRKTFLVTPARRKNVRRRG